MSLEQGDPSYGGKHVDEGEHVKKKKVDYSEKIKEL